ncbi:MAG: AAA family ATPase [Anaerolineales bacterium]|nr:AAA family ATPase [Anaerolineales bacterium]
MKTDSRHPARLKSLELQGYKSFAVKTRFDFADTITAVVGPNGSGKSNIADAIRWVLGEQSYRSLRARKTEDMIFAGSQGRSRAGMAAATITFDNSDGWLPIDFAEVSVGRRAHRDGQNEYLLNGQRVRLRDIQDLLGSSGLAERSYTIVGQGLVDSVLSLKAEERSKLFEEAAGITVHRIRRDESIRRLEKTRLNLDRVKDILAEIRPRLRSLERQAEQAAAHDSVLEDLRQALEQWYGHHWYLLQDELKTARELAETAARGRDDLHRESESATRLLGEASQRVNELRDRRQVVARDAKEAATSRETLTRDLAVAEQRLVWLQDEERSFDGEIVGLETAKADVGERLVLAKKETLEKAKGQSLPGFIQARSEAQADQERSKLADQIEALDSQVLRLSQERASFEARLEIGSKAALDSDQFAQRMREAADRGALPGLIGDLGPNFKVKANFETAILAVLDGFDRGVVFKDDSQVDSALDWLTGEHPSGRLGLLPLTRSRRLPPLQVPGDPDCLGCAADFVTASQEYDSAIQLLLGRTLVVRERKTAKRLLEGLPLDARVVTLSGEVFYPAGQVLVSSNGKSLDNPDRMRAQLEQLDGRITQLKHERAEIFEQRERLESEVRAGLSGEVVKASQAKVNSLEEQFHSYAGRLAEMRSQLVRNNEEQRRTREGTEQIRERLEHDSTHSSAAITELENLEAGLTRADEQRSEILVSETANREARRQAEDLYTSTQIKSARLKQQSVEMERRVQEDFGLVSYEGGEGQEPLPLENLVAHLERIDIVPEGLEKQVDKLRRKLRRMGSINPAARREYEEVNERHSFLSEQIEDMNQAQVHLKQVISELDEQMASQFQITFEAVSATFEAYFVRLFGGGAAKLSMLQVEGSDRSGIEIEVRLPGRRARGLAMLSGGERSLTAVALIFALLKVSPTPFCVLDEVDAMLDESNVLRFGEILRELSEDTQFLVITHNRQTIQEAEVLYGISLGKDKASEVISLRLDQAAEKMAA